MAVGLSERSGRLAGFTPIAENDFILKYCIQDDSVEHKSWCVFRRGLIIFVDGLLDDALYAAQRRAAAYGCKAWLISPNKQPVEISRAVL